MNDRIPVKKIVTKKKGFERTIIAVSTSPHHPPVATSLDDKSKGYKQRRAVVVNETKE